MAWQELHPTSFASCQGNEVVLSAAESKTDTMLQVAFQLCMVPTLH
jgi:hypothetical protein